MTDEFEFRSSERPLSELLADAPRRLLAPDRQEVEDFLNLERFSTWSNWGLESAPFVYPDHL